MSEPLSEQQRAILKVLAEERDELAQDLSPRAIHTDAFHHDSRVGRTKEQLGRLRWRGFVEETPGGLWRITDAGVEAL